MTKQTDATMSRALMRRAAIVALASLGEPGKAAIEPDESDPLIGWPQNTLALCACDLDATPLLLLSDLADHSHNIASDNRIALLFTGRSEAPKPGGQDDPEHAALVFNPLTQPRVSVLGRAEINDDPRLRARFLARHPCAAPYADFTDFRLYRVEVIRAHLVAGFGKTRGFDRKSLILDDIPTDLLAGESQMIAHMNADHGAAIARFAAHAETPKEEPEEETAPDTFWEMTGLDPEGCDLQREGGYLRFDFGKIARKDGEIRSILVDLATKT